VEVRPVNISGVLLAIYIVILVLGAFAKEALLSLVIATSSLTSAMEVLPSPVKLEEAFGATAVSLGSLIGTITSDAFAL